MAGKKSKPADEERQKTILVVGDYLVDEHWVMGIHRSSTSSRTGRLHLRALHDPDSTVESFCGAAQVASILHGATLRNAQGARGLKAPFRVVGLGMWHDSDTRILEKMMDRRTHVGQTPHRVTRKASLSKLQKATLINLGQLLPSSKHQAKPGTTRVIRIYQNKGAKVELLGRLDWEMRPPGDHGVWFNGRMPLRGLQKLFDEEGIEGVDAIVIKDLCKGVISRPVIKALKARFKGASWFISSKEWLPRWMIQELKNEHVQLLVVPQVAASNARSSDQHGQTHNLAPWITRDGLPSESTLDAFERAFKIFSKQRNMLTVVLPGGLSMIAKRKHEPSGWIQPMEKGETLAVGLPMASILFSALVAQLLHGSLQMRTQEILDRAMAYTLAWQGGEIRRIWESEKWTPKSEPSLEVPLSLCAPVVHAANEIDWKACRRSWNASRLDRGIIHKKYVLSTYDRLELHRAMVEVDGYVCCVRENRLKLQIIKDDLRAFLESRPRSHTGFMLVSKPGMGKTHLVRRLARALDFRFLPFNITQMLTRNDLLESFDTIVTSQAQDRNQPILVFIDEINALLDSQPVYDAFLAPLYEGVYIRGGKTFHINPCVWVFAGTADPRVPSRGVRSQPDNVRKASDFVSRLMRLPMSLEVEANGKSRGRILREKRLEKVYTAAALLKVNYPDVRWLSRSVIEHFYWLSPDVAVRDLEKYIKTFHNIQLGEVLIKNVPADPGTLRWSKMPPRLGKKGNDLVEIFV